MSERKHTGQEWSEWLGVRVLDPDGWREDGLPFETPITLAEWQRRFAMSTVGPWDWNLS